MKLVLKNVGTGFQTFGIGEASVGPKIGIDRGGEMPISAEQFSQYEPDIRYFHTAKAGEVKAALFIDGEKVSPDDVAALIASEAHGIASPAPEEQDGAGPAVLVPQGQTAPKLASPGEGVTPLVVNHTGAVDPNAAAGEVK